MALIRIREFDSRIETEDFINDVIRGSNPVSSEIPLNLDTLTLTFTTPAKTVTFVGTKLRANEIVGQINTQTTEHTAAIRRLSGGDSNFIALIKDADVLTGGTAAATLGLAAATVGANKIVLAKLNTVGTKGASGDSYYVVYEE